MRAKPVNPSATVVRRGLADPPVRPIPGRSPASSDVDRPLAHGERRLLHRLGQRRVRVH